MKKPFWLPVSLFLLLPSSLGVVLLLQNRVEGQDSSPQDQKESVEKKFQSLPLSEPEMPFSQKEALTKGFVLLKGGGYLFEREDGTEGVVVPGRVLLDKGLTTLDWVK